MRRARGRARMARWQRWLMVVVPAAVALATATGSAQAYAPAPIPCHSIGSGKYDCQFYPAGDGISAGAPVMSPSGHRIGYLNHGTNYVFCEAKGEKVTTGSYYNVWWAYTLANDDKYGWVSAVYAHGGANDGDFAHVPACGSAHGYPPGGAPAPAPTPPPTSTPAPSGEVPCAPVGGGKYDCTWYLPGDGQTGGTPVLSSTGGRVGYLHQGTNWIICQQQGAERSSGSYHNDWYGWTLSDNGGYGWANAVYASGGANDGEFAGVPNCNSAYGSAPSGSPGPAPTPTPTPTPIPGTRSVSAVRQKIVSIALAQRGYAMSAGHCDRYGDHLACPGDPYYQEWCSVMATWVWEQAGINIPIMGYSGDPYFWAGPGGDGQTGGHATVYGPHHHAQPGDMVFFGSTKWSAHVAIVLKRYSSGEILVMNGNDYDGRHPGGIALESTFYPSDHGDVNGTGGPVYAYAAPERDGHVATHTRVLDALVRAGSPDLLKHQDPRGPQLKQQREERRHPAAQHMPFVGKRITIEVTNVTRGGRYYVEVLYRGSRRSAERDFRHFLRRYHDPGKAYVVRYVTQR